MIVQTNLLCFILQDFQCFEENWVVNCVPPIRDTYCLDILAAIYLLLPRRNFSRSRENETMTSQCGRIPITTILASWDITWIGLYCRVSLFCCVTLWRNKLFTVPTKIYFLCCHWWICIDHPSHHHRSDSIQSTDYIATEIGFLRQKLKIWDDRLGEILFGEPPNNL